MKASNLISDLINGLEHLNSEISNLDESFAVFVATKQAENELFEKFIILMNKYPCHPLILSRLLEFLQLVESEELCHISSLEDIEMTYSKLADLFQDDVDINLEYFYYVFNVIGDEKKARHTLNNFKKRVLTKLDMSQ